MSKKQLEIPTDEKLRHYEQQIIHYYIERANFGGQSDTLASLIGYLSIYGELSQSDLKRLTGFSKSTISTGLSNLLNIHYVKKEKLPKKREHLYSLMRNSQEKFDDALGSLELEIQFFRQKIEELEQNYSPEDFGYNLLKERLKEALEVFETYQRLLNFLRSGENVGEQDFRLNMEKGLSKNDLIYLLKDFDPQIKRFEDSIIEFFKYQSAYSTLSDYMLNMFIYFLTRKVLTQDKIKKLTGLSSGKISQVVNRLLKKKFILEVNKDVFKKSLPENLERRKLYAMTSIKESFFQSGVDSLKEMLKWREKFTKMKDELRKMKDQCENHRIHGKLSKAVEEILDLMVRYEKAISLFLPMI